MAEGRTYVIEWTRSDDGWTLRVRGERRLQTMRGTFEKALDEIGSQIGARFGDGEPLFTYDPPLPTRASDDEYLRDGLALFDGTGYTQLRERYPFHLFAGGPCRHCAHPTGRRSELPVQLEGAIREHVTSCPFFYYSPLLVSEEFLSLLTDSERACCEWRRCERERRARRVMYEVLPRVFVRVASPTGFRMSGWCCLQCGFSCAAAMDESSDIHEFAWRTELPEPLPELFGVGSLVAGLKIGGRASRLRELLRHKHSLGMYVSPLGVLDLDFTSEVALPPLRDSKFTPKLESEVAEYESRTGRSAAPARFPLAHRPPTSE